MCHAQYVRLDRPGVKTERDITISISLQSLTIFGAQIRKRLFDVNPFLMTI